MASHSELRLRSKPDTLTGPPKLSTETDGQPSSEPKVDMEKDKKGCSSCGKTPDGKTFRVPTTREMVTSLLNPKESKSFFDWITLGTMAVEVALFFMLPLHIKQILFIFIFAFWRLAYNVGLGILLKYQSDQRGLVRWAKQNRLFDPTNPKTCQWLQQQLSMKMGSDYDFETAPLEYNTWLLFRQLVDLILMNDFTAYMCFALSWVNTSPQSSGIFGDALRWIGGLFLVAFNIWVKVDAQRVVKDFAWYWGDFFFLIEQSLTFDGVFEMAPHPMYSVGYFGYYGVSMICASYTVLFVSMAAHALQFAFLALVETPHIEKTYNPPTKALRKRRLSYIPATLDEDAASMIDIHSGRDFYATYFRRDLIVFKNFDLCRSTDLVSAFVMFYALVLPLLIPGKLGVVFAVLQALLWRIFHTCGLGWLLRAQSANKFLTRHFVKWGGGAQEAFKNWKSLFNLSLCMTYVTFFAACWKMYSFPEDWTYGTTLLRHTLGLIFISLHIWTSVSIYEVLGDFGWFYGDFFIDEYQTTLLYTGIYRFLNNPEKIMGHAAFWGMTLMTNSWTIFGLALFSQISSFLFLHYVEAPHMQKLYGDQIRKEAGLTKTLRTAATKTIPDKLQHEIAKLIHEKAELQAAVGSTKHVERLMRETMEKIEKAIEETAGAVGDIMGAAGPRLQEVLAETKMLLDTTTQSSRTSRDLDAYDPDLYSLALEKTTFVFGQPICVHWTAPEHHSPKDWIGVYKVGANKSDRVTAVSSRGRWFWTTPSAEEEDEEEDKASILPQGAVIFSGDKLPWEVGMYEFRYHHDGKYDVMAMSKMIEITAPSSPVQVQDSNAVQLSLLKLIQNVLGNNPDLMPVSPLEDYDISMGETEAQRVAYAIQVMYGVEFAWEVVLADKCVARLTKRIQHAVEAITPTGQKVIAGDRPKSP
ncbi:phosphatidylethanolamine N-methyltransferase [Apophysomyces sp. BC1034]|nr:phosphatidylethanolamine N-methyltransferase [Apophysomyces sp. BC1015]KAG0178597.1 phosphatidylethanolamine N-methyltransferase [Apophysomyces sp. BC1021]KAG0188938.1 phosphatidylethanolamine N-methyltransferase [Apophysomyces sp. BC1034]